MTMTSDVENSKNDIVIMRQELADDRVDLVGLYYKWYARCVG